MKSIISRGKHDLIVEFPRNELIVDFPRGEATISDDTKNVHFAATDEVTLIAVPSDEEINTRWYSKQEKKQFVSMLRQDVQEMAEVFAEGGGDHPTEIEICKCVGIENFLSPDMLKLVKKIRNSHRLKIINEYSRQQLRNIRDEEKLARISRSSSKWFFERAHIIASKSYNTK